MPLGGRVKPERLAEKLLQIRVALNLSQTDLLRRLGLEEDYFYTIISKNELGTREPMPGRRADCVQACRSGESAIAAETLMNNAG